MARRVRTFLAAALLAAASVSAAAEGPLSVVKAGPTGESASLAQVNEIRVVFSEPMVVLGRIPEPVTAPFFSIRPPVSGSFRWSGTTTLIFTPDRAKPLPYSTRFEVTVAASATAVSGRKLGKAYTFSFTTPTVRLLRTSWYRLSGKSSSPLLVLLRFNQPVKAEALLPHVHLRFRPHTGEWSAPTLPPEGVAWLKEVDPKSIEAFQFEAAQAFAAVKEDGPVSFARAASWDTKRYPASDDLVVLQTDAAPPTDAWIEMTIDGAAPGLQGSATPDKEQTYTLKLESTFFVNGFRCSSACNPDDYNPLQFRARVGMKALRAALKVWDVTDPAKPVALIQAADKGEGQEQGGDAPEGGEEDYDVTSWATLDEAGFSLKPARSYLVQVDRSLTAADGQVLGYTWAGGISNWHATAFSSFGTGHGVWESTGGPQLPFSARNLTDVTQWVSALKPADLMPVVKKLQVRPLLASKPGSGEPQPDWNWREFSEPPPVPPTERQLHPVPDEIQFYGINLSKFLDPQGFGLVWAAVKDGGTIPQSRHAGSSAPQVNATLVQVTNLGITVKDSPLNTLVFVTRLDDGRPVEGARVSIVTPGNKAKVTGTTGRDGLVVLDGTDLRNHRDWGRFAFIVTAEKDGDFAYVCSDWNEGIEPWVFGNWLNLEEAKPLLRGTVFADRGVYKLGEEVHLKAILRSDTATGMVLLPKGQQVEIVLKDSQGGEVDKRTLQLNGWSACDWAVTLPGEGPLGNYRVEATVKGQEREVDGSFLVAAYRRPDFRVDADLGGTPPVAGTSLKGAVTARYLFGAAMAGRPVRWTFSKAPSDSVPSAITHRFPPEQFVFLGRDPSVQREGGTIRREEAKLDAEGRLVLDLATDAKAGFPYRYTLEGEVTDLSRQTIAGRASFLLHPMPFYVGLKTPPYFAEADKGLDTAVVAASLEGQPQAGVTVHVTLTQVQWHSVRRAEGKGFYTWECERKEVQRGNWDVVTGAEPAALHIPLPEGGYYLLRASASDAEGRSTTTVTDFYALGAGYTAWERYDSNKIDLVPERKSYKPGEAARILIKSPWEKATALLTTEREGVRIRRTFELSGTQPTVEVPITEQDIPNLYVSVLLVKGRTEGYTTKDQSDPGKPAFRLGYVQLKVEDAAKRLSVAVKSDKEEYRPAEKAAIQVQVNDPDGSPGQAEVTLWAVDYGVLSLTAYKTPSVREWVWVDKALQVLTEDSRQRIISRRVLTPKGADAGGGGGAENGPGTPVRKDFRVLAFWLGSLATDSRGIAKTEVTLPESLTTYRIMAVVQDRASRFGWGQREIRISKPVLLSAAFPRFLALGDTALFGSVLHSQLKEGGTAIVTMRSLDPGVLELAGEGSQTVAVGPKGSVEVRFPVRTSGVGKARIEMTAKLLGQSDAFEQTLPVEVLVSPEVVAAYGQADPSARETVEIPAGVVPGVGGLHLELASTAMVGLGEGARFLVDYPYGCAEQRASCALALVLASDLGDAFRLPGIEPAKLHDTAQATLKELEAYQCENGGFVYWKGSPCAFASAYLTSYVLHVYQRAQKLGYAVNPKVLSKGYDFLDQQLNQPPPTNEGWWPAFTAWECFAAKVLAEGGRNEDSTITRLYGYLDRMPVFALAYLSDAMAAAGETGQRPAEVMRRLTNAILPEGGTAHVEELADPYLLWFWNSNVRSTGLVLDSFVRHGDEKALVPGMVRWLMKVRKNGRWGNTQENAVAMEALVDYYKRYEKEVPDFTAVVKLGADTLATDTFRDRSAQARLTDLPMAKLLAREPAATRLPLTFDKQGTGTLFYVASLKYAADQLFQQGMDQGIRIERSYAPYSEKGEAGAPATSFKAGDLVQVTLTLSLTKERRYVAVSDPLPSGFEPVESWFATTASDLARAQVQEETQAGDWTAWWKRGGFDHVERHDDHVLLFATRLSEGPHTFSYVCRATTSGTFRTAPAHAEEMYEPEVFGRTGTAVIEVKK